MSPSNKALAFWNLPERSSQLDDAFARDERREQLGPTPKHDPFDVSQIDRCAPFPLFFTRFPIFDFGRINQPAFTLQSPLTFNTGHGTLHYVGPSLTHHHLDVLLAISLLINKHYRNHQSAEFLSPRLASTDGRLEVDQLVARLAEDLSNLVQTDRNNLVAMQKAVANTHNLINQHTVHFSIDLDRLLLLLGRPPSPKAREVLRIQILELNQARFLSVDCTATHTKIPPAIGDQVDARINETAPAGNWIRDEEYRFFSIAGEWSADTTQYQTAKLTGGTLYVEVSDWYLSMITRADTYTMIDLEYWKLLDNSAGYARAIMLYLSAIEPANNEWRIPRRRLYDDIVRTEQQGDDRWKEFPRAIKRGVNSLIDIGWLREGSGWLTDSRSDSFSSLFARSRH